MLLDRIISETKKLPAISERTDAFSRTLLYRQDDREAIVSFFSLFPGIALAYIRAETGSWPIPEAIRQDHSHRLMMLCYCLNGRNKICLNSRDAVSIGSGELTIVSCFPEHSFLYPTQKHEGITILIDPDELNVRQDYLKKDFGIDLPAMTEKFFSRNTFCTVPAMHEYKEAMKVLWDLFPGDSAYSFLQMKICVLSVLLIVTHIPSIPVSHKSFYLTASQIRIAENVHAILSADLSCRHSARELAEQFGISESSLKNYFKSVYGKSFAVYQRDARMQKGAELLKTTLLSVAEIAASVGYISQSKFSDVFRKEFGVSPLEYRRLCGIHSEP